MLENKWSLKCRMKHTLALWISLLSSFDLILSSPLYGKIETPNTQSPFFCIHSFNAHHELIFFEFFEKLHVLTSVRWFSLGDLVLRPVLTLRTSCSHFWWKLAWKQVLKFWPMWEQTRRTGIGKSFLKKKNRMGFHMKTQIWYSGSGRENG
jgi:hypothetical protein